ncbi:MAG: HAMP domain-containing protein [Acidobacteriota bacterium]
MKITTRIASGFGLLIAILAGLVVYQVITINRMQALGRTLSQTNFENVRDSLQVMRDRDLVEEFTEKFFASPGYADGLRAQQEDFERSLGELRAHAQSNEEKAEVKRLALLWDAYKADFGLLQNPLPQSGPLPPNLQEDLDGLKAQTDSVYQASLRSTSSRAEASRKTGETAVVVLWCATAVALAGSILVSLLIIRSISKPLAQLTEGTRAIADGKILYRLDTSRKDEFSQLARDFNTMTSHLNELEDRIKKLREELQALEALDLQRRPSPPRG